MNNPPDPAAHLTPTPPDATPPPALLSTQRAAAYLAISRRTLWALTEAKRIRAIKFGKRLVRYAIADLDAFVAAHGRGGR